MNKFQVGTYVKSLRDFLDVPQGTEGVIDELYSGGVMVAWNLPSSPLPAHYCAFDGVPAIRSRILRDGFSDDELVYLEPISKLTEKLTDSKVYVDG